MVGQRHLPYECWKGGWGCLQEYEGQLKGMWGTEQGVQESRLSNKSTPKYGRVTQRPDLDGLALVSQMHNVCHVWIMEQCLLSHWFLWAENNSSVLKSRAGLFFHHSGSLFRFPPGTEDDCCSVHIRNVKNLTKYSKTKEISNNCWNSLLCWRKQILFL